MSRQSFQDENLVILHINCVADLFIQINNDKYICSDWHRLIKKVFRQRYKSFGQMNKNKNINIG